MLSDPQKRSLYDKFGSDGLKNIGPRNGDVSGATDIARELFKGFGFGGGFGGGFRGFSSMPLVFHLELSLEDLFKGRSLEIPISNTRIKLEISPGMYEGMEIRVRGKAMDENGFPRDLVFRIKEASHPYFLRRNADLLMEMNISISDSLFGFQRSLRLLDGEEIVIRSIANETIQPDAIYCLEGKGMPLYDQPTRGRLFVKTKLILPQKLNLQSDSAKQLKKLLKEAINGDTMSSTSPDKSEIEEESADGSITLSHANLQSFGEFGLEEDGVDDDDINAFARYFFR